MCKLDLKDTYLSIPIHKSSRKFLKFHWQGVAYEYTALPFGLSAAPRTFTKVLKPVLAALRAKGIRLVAYLDDLLIIGKDKECAEEAFQTTKSLLQALGFVVNLEKSQSQAAQEIEFLGFIINSREMTFRIPTARVKQIKNDTKQILQKEQVTVRELAHIVGVLASTRLAVLPAPLHYRAHQGQKNEGLHHHLSYESMVTLSSQSREDLQWWINHLSRNNGKPIHHPPPNMVIESDASDTGWGACYEGLTTRGQWSREESRLHINCKELLAAFLAVQIFSKKQEKDAYQTSSRQYDSHVLYQQYGGFAFSKVDATNFSVLELEPGKGHPYISRALTGQAKPDRRSGIQDAGRQLRMEAETSGVLEVDGTVGSLPDRSVCIMPYNAIG